MRKPESYANRITSDERYCRREQCGVEIIERDVVTRIRTSSESRLPSRSQTRLVITDAINATREFVSKRRCEFRELDNFLKTVARRQLPSE